MIVETVVTALFNAVPGVIRLMIDRISAGTTAPDYVFYVPEPLWFIVSYILAWVTVIFPIGLAWWVWRQVKA